MSKEFEILDRQYYAIELLEFRPDKLTALAVLLGATEDSLRVSLQSVLDGDHSEFVPLEPAPGNDMATMIRTMEFLDAVFLNQPEVLQ
jgi:hypothetical protein